jgi:hypothetical protein
MALSDKEKSYRGVAPESRSIPHPHQTSPLPLWKRGLWGGFMEMIRKVNSYGGLAPYAPYNPQTPTRPSPYPLYQRKQGEGSCYGTGNVIASSILSSHVSIANGRGFRPLRILCGFFIYRGSEGGWFRGLKPRQFMRRYVTKRG